MPAVVVGMLLSLLERRGTQRAGPCGRQRTRRRIGEQGGSKIVHKCPATASPHGGKRWLVQPRPPFLLTTYAARRPVRKSSLLPGEDLKCQAFVFRTTLNY